MGYFVEEGHDVAVGNVLLGRFSGDGQYHNVIVEEVTEAGYKVLFTEHEGEDGDREELPREHLRYYYPDEGSDDGEVGYPVEEGHEIAVGNNLLGKVSQYYDVVVEEVTEMEPRFYSTSSDRGELPGSACASTTATRRFTCRGGCGHRGRRRALGRRSDDGQYCDCVVEEVTEAGLVLFTAYDDDETWRTPRPPARSLPARRATTTTTRRTRRATRRVTSSGRMSYRSAPSCSTEKVPAANLDVVIEEVTDTGAGCFYRARVRTATARNSRSSTALLLS